MSACESSPTGEWLPDQQERVHWAEFGRLAEHCDSLPIKGEETTLRWLRETDFPALAGEPRTDRVLRAADRRLPYPVFDRARSVYERAQTVSERLDSRGLPLPGGRPT